MLGTAITHAYAAPSEGWDMMHRREDGIGRRAMASRMGQATMALLSLALTTPVHAATRGYTITSFDVIRVDAPVRVTVTTGAAVSARAEGDQALLDRLRVTVSGQVLAISMDRQAGEKRRDGVATLTLSTSDLRRIVLTGGGSIAVNRMKGQSGDIVMGGSGDISIADVALDRLVVGMAGSGRVSLAGRASDATIRVTGPGAVDAAALRTRQLIIDNAGPAAITASAEVTAKVSTTGSGEISVTGPAACTIANRGTGAVDCGRD